MLFRSLQSETTGVPGKCDLVTEKRNENVLLYKKQPEVQEKKKGSEYNAKKCSRPFVLQRERPPFKAWGLASATFPTSEFHSFKGSIIFHSLYTPHLFIGLFVNGHLGCFYLLALVNNGAMNSIWCTNIFSSPCLLIPWIYT